MSSISLLVKILPWFFRTTLDDGKGATTPKLPHTHRQHNTRSNPGIVLWNMAAFLKTNIFFCRFPSVAAAAGGGRNFSRNQFPNGGWWEGGGGGKRGSVHLD